jgi:hypothetical protein
MNEECSDLIYEPFYFEFETWNTLIL